MEKITNSPSQTQQIASDFAKDLKTGDVIALHGELGAGKTVFVQGLAKGLGIANKITSPTFVFVKSYKAGKIFLHHLDLYRGEKIKDFESLGLDEIFSPDSITIIEWAQRLKDRLPKKRWDIFIDHINENQRKIRFIQHK